MILLQAQDHIAHYYYSACILTVADVPAVDEVLAVASLPVDLGVPVLL